MVIAGIEVKSERATLRFPNDSSNSGLTTAHDKIKSKLSKIVLPDPAKRKV